MNSRGVYEHELTQNVHKATMNMVYTEKSWAKLYKKYTKFAILTKRTLLWVRTQARIVIYLLYNRHTFLSGSCSKMEKGR